MISFVSGRLRRKYSVTLVFDEPGGPETRMPLHLHKEAQHVVINEVELILV